MHFPLHPKQILYKEYGCRCAGGIVPEREREREREMIKLPCRPFDRPKQLQISNPALQFSTKQTNADFYSGSSRLETLLGLRQPWQVFRGFPWFL